MFSNFLSRFFSTNTARRRNQSSRFPIASLEARTLLAGNVTAAIVEGELVLTGDDAANDIQILKTSAGVIVRGNSTTINGGSADFVAFAPSMTTTGPIRADMGAGDDKVQIDGLTLDERVSVAGGEGNDKLGITNSTLKLLLTFDGGNGNDNLVVDRSTFERSLIAQLGAGDDLATLTNSEIKHSLIVYSGEGADGLNLNATKVDRWLIGYMGAGNDKVLLSNGSDIKHVQLWGGHGADLIEVQDSDSTSFAARMGLGKDDDSLAFSGDVDVDKWLIIRGRGGEDSFAKGTGTLPHIKIIGAEKDTVDTATLSGQLGLSADGLQNDAAKAKADFVASTFVRLATTEGNVDIELFSKDAPITVANFLNYMGRYSNSIVHRSLSNFVIQGGGFTPTAITTDPPIPNEFSSTHSNVTGTLSMALPSDSNQNTLPDAGTSQWFINVVDNTSLDSKKHTVFGRVLGTGMTVVNAINALTSFNIAGALQNSALTDTPLKNYSSFTQNLTGTVTATVGSITVNGTNTKFNTELVAGAVVQIAGVNYIVKQITSATQMTLTSAITTAATAATAKGNAAPTAAQYVKINSVTIIDNPA